ncbi:YolD-like family protein [Peribacillus loiseleuriae]|uniref:YolD-like family protein n=1 Tax=Peribacillus loiseleuriae TaxID=1679170 RepID=UPI003D092A9D
MLKDRGTIKWTAMMLPEHVQSLNDALVSEQSIVQPILDEQELEAIELTICEAITFNNPIITVVYSGGYTNTITGTVHYINHMESQMILQDNEGLFHHIPFKKLLACKKHNA